LPRDGVNLRTGSPGFEPEAPGRHGTIRVVLDAGANRLAETCPLPALSHSPARHSRWIAAVTLPADCVKASHDHPRRPPPRPN
jgi:hypothetical protein